MRETAAPKGERLLIGRDTELAVLIAALDGARVRSCGVVLEGDPGIGKSALIARTVQGARAGGHRVLVAMPTRVESPFAFAALADLLRDVDLSALHTAPARILEVALGQRPTDGAPPSVSELGFAVVSVIESIVSAGEQVLFVIDDAQWMDSASRQVVAFALRRLPAVGVCALLGWRTEHETPDHGFGGPGFERRRLQPLPAATIEQIVHTAVDPPLAGHLVDRVVEVSGGNPLMAIEFARATSEAVVHVGQPLPVPAPLMPLLTTRFQALPAPTVAALAAIAMLTRPTVDILSRLGHLADLAAAERAGVIAVSGRQITFRHPLYAAVAEDLMTATERLVLHGALADVTDGTERFLHLALAATRPDAALAAALTDAAQRDVARGAAAGAAEIALLALAVTPDDDALRWDRMLLTGDVLFRAGRTEEAVAQISAVHTLADSATHRARALLAWSTIEFSRSADAEVAARLARRCLDETDDPKLLAEAHGILARVDYIDFVEAAEHAAQALAIVETGDAQPAELARALVASAGTAFSAGGGVDRAMLEQAMALEPAGEVLSEDSAFATLAAILKYSDELDESLQMFEQLLQRADPGSLPYALGHLPQLHLWAGRWQEAERCALRHLQLADRSQQDSQREAARYNLAVIAAHRGETADAEPVARRLFEQGAAEDVPWTERLGAGLLGLIAMSDGDAVAAVEHFGRYDELGERMRLLEPGYSRFHGDLVEALVATGDIARAVAVLDRVGERAVRCGRVSSLAAVSRGRALVAAHSGDDDAALAAARQAVEIVAPTALVFDHSRALLTLGVVARRAKERGTARAALGQALAQFDQMGALSLAERCRRELGRVSGRTAVPSGLTTLTATEASVAQHAAAGHTTRQIAAAMFISVKTVEANLTRVYRKLGITNRAQLANHFSAATERPAGE